MVIPEFPRFREVDLSCKDIVNGYLTRYPLEASEYTFTNIFAYRAESAYNFKLSLFENNLLILRDRDPVSFLCPVGHSHMRDVMLGTLEHLRQKTAGSHPADTEPYLERVPEIFVERFIKGDRDFILREERDQFDYLYDVRELVELKGNKFHDKKNQVNKFRSRYKYEYITITPDLVDECLAFEDYWCEVKECEKHESLKKEQCAILQMLNNLGALGIKGGAIIMEGKIAALTLGEQISAETLLIHVEKANPRIPGLYQIINQEFLMHEADECRLVNREQDLGITGLRRAKLSYNPVRFVRKYRVGVRTDPGR